MKITCQFAVNRRGLVFCKVHKESLMYRYKNGVILCIVEEDRLISEEGWDKYIEGINKLKQEEPIEGE